MSPTVSGHQEARGDIPAQHRSNVQQQSAHGLVLHVLLLNNGLFNIHCWFIKPRSCAETALVVPARCLHGGSCSGRWTAPPQCLGPC